MKDASAALRDALSKLRREQAARAGPPEAGSGDGAGALPGDGAGAVSRDAAGGGADDGGRADDRGRQGDGERSPVERWLSGKVIEAGAGRCFLHQRLHSSLEPAREKREQFRAVAARLAAFEACGAHRDLIAAARLGLDRAVVLDLETTGFASTPVFLAGCLVPRDDDFVVMQYFARDYSEEKALVAAVAALLEDAEVLITYNGKSYDLPLLRDRAALHGLSIPEAPLHLDLLHHARRRYRGRLPDCRLVTLESSRLQKHRFQDVPGADIPRLYHEFVRSGDFAPLLPVFHHNIFDLLTLSSLIGDLLLSEPLEDPPRSGAEGDPHG